MAPRVFANTIVDSDTTCLGQPAGVASPMVSSAAKVLACS
jgi:hypothetical protein